MDMMAGINASFSGLHAQRMRMNIIATNLANAHTTRTPEGGPYKPQQVVFGASSSLSSFEQLLISQQREQGVREVRVLGITEDPEGV